MRILVRNGLILDPDINLQEIGDLWIENGKVVCIKTASISEGEIPAEEEELTIDAQGKWVVPGLIDLHVHFRDPGFEYKEDIFTGCQAAARGGFTTVCCMPNTKPVIDCPEVVKYIDEKVEKANGVNVLAVGSITQGQKGETLADINGMAELLTRSTKVVGKGICAVSEDGRSVMNAKLMLEGILEAKENGLMVFSHTEDDSLAGTKIGEELIVARDIMLAKEAKAPIHLCHISTKGSLDIIRQAKTEGVHVTAETGPHYFVFDQSCVNDDGNKKMNPPLRDQEDVEAVIDALKDGTLDVIATDHAPHSSEEKDHGYEKAMNGVVGLETSFAVSYTMLVKNGILTPLELIDKMSCKPAEILGADRGTLAVGKTADLAIIDIDKEYEIKAEDFLSKSKNSPFLGLKVFGKVEYTIVNGQIVYAAH
ncbi:dihydroorotase [Clostridium aminobutyricum]|uniref:Dihydroorotase n=1 Tax=Clostridium aminobutyricum TaxID=33953 RepID=A0A939D6G7_CLOAM|nr:dihydroorotase [Clostridium aminobutyricum]MBN7771967.1 dihydroorotase [Clostridium aminobutyricum]